MKLLNMFIKTILKTIYNFKDMEIYNNSLNKKYYKRKNQAITWFFYRFANMNKTLSKYNIITATMNISGRIMLINLLFGCFE